jgi:excinuclease ABC subunit C
MSLEQFKKRAKKIPDAPGVYFFLDKRKKVLYIGKATSVRSRVRSYFAPDLHEVRSPLVANMIAEAVSIDWRKTDSVLEALILEASLIKIHKPKANTDLKDDKSFNYVVITQEEYPRILVVRGKNLNEAPKVKKTFGPFPHGLQLKEAMKLVRKIFPFRDTCVPNSGKPCFNAQVGLCPGVCSGVISKQDYKKIIRHIVLLFQGKKKQLITLLGREMKLAAKEEQFEQAALLRRQLFALQHIQDVSLIKDEYREYGHRKSIYRIEAYDVAHFAGSAAVGVMAVVEGGEAQKNEYRKFKIKSAKPGDDTGALREILSRRLGHSEWPMPRLIAVDGGAAQINAAKKILNGYGVGIPVVGVVKDERHRPRNIVGAKEYVRGREKEIFLANAEAHRFAVKFHRKIFRKRVRSGPLGQA